MFLKCLQDLLKIPFSGFKDGGAKNGTVVETVLKAALTTRTFQKVNLG
jgi:hypothetical protein